MNTKHISFIVCILSVIFVLQGCSRTKVESRIIDRKYQVYEIAVQSYEDCGGLWHTTSTCIANLRPQIRGVASSVCGKPPANIHSCAERAVDDGRQIYCTVECNEVPNVDESVLRKAERCQQQGGVWVNDRCELKL